MKNAHSIIWSEFFQTKHRILFALFYCGCLFTVLPCFPVRAADKPANAYEVVFEGIKNKKLISELKSISDTLALKDRPPKTVKLLRRRMERDKEHFIKLLRSRGYYGPSVDGRIHAEVQPIRIVFQVNLGPAYVLGQVEIRFDEENIPAPYPEKPTPKEMGLVPGKPLQARSIIDAQKKLLRGLRVQGFPFPAVGRRDVVVDHASRTVRVTFHVLPGSSAVFGSVTVTGLKTVEESFVRAYIPWRENQVYSADLLSTLQARLIKTGLFSTVRVIAAQALNPAGQLPVAIALTERKHRSIGAGVGYRTDEGPGAKVSWEHRNFFGRGEKTGVSVTASDFTRNAEGIFWKPLFLRNDQNLNFALRLATDEPDAYRSESIKGSAIIDRTLRKKWVFSAGLGYKISQVEQLGAEESFKYAYVPLQLSRDTSDNFLDPTRGARLALQMTPYSDILGGELHFVKGIFGYRHYIRVIREPAVIIALRGAVGVIGGEKQKDIPADERFYVGGGGSIRGYAYQSVGPLSGDIPLGGRSFLEVSAEARMNFTNRFGMVIFLDGGSAFRDDLFDSSEDVLWGSGVGLRYATPIGPLRVDVGIPLDRREGVDDSFQIYVSLGQAF